MLCAASACSNGATEVTLTVKLQAGGAVGNRKLRNQCSVMHKIFTFFCYLNLYFNKGAKHVIDWTIRQTFNADYDRVAVVFDTCF